MTALLPKCKNFGVYEMALNLFLFFVIIAAMLPILCEKDD